MDILSAYQAEAAVALDDMAKLCGFPGKLETEASVQDLFNKGEISKICDYCETEVLNTFGVYLRFELMRSNIDQSLYQANLDLLERYLEHMTANGKNAHLAEFLAAWRQNRQFLADLRNAQNAQMQTQNNPAEQESNPQENQENQENSSAENNNQGA